MLKLKIPFTIAMLTHLLLFASVGGVLPRGTFNDFTPVEMIELPKDELKQAQAQPVRKTVAPVKTVKPIAEPIKAEPQKTAKVVDEVKPVIAKEPVREAVNETKAEDAPKIKEAKQERVFEAATVNKTAEPIKREKGQGVAEFNSYVRQRIEKAKFYPAWAQQRGYEGTVGVKFNILPDGRVEDIKVVRPCHCEILNRAACEAVEKAAPFLRPSGLDNKVIAMEVDLGFRLK